MLRPPLEMIAEWRKGCTCGGPVHDQCFPDEAPTSPAQCQECTEALIDALEKALQQPELVGPSWDADDDPFDNVTNFQTTGVNGWPLERLWLPTITSVTLSFPNEFADRPEDCVGRSVRFESDGRPPSFYRVEAVDGEKLLLSAMIDDALEEG